MTGSKAMAVRWRFARVWALALLVSLAAPWAAICLPGAPGAMPCCLSSERDRQPDVKACCGPKAPEPASVHVASTLVAAPAAIATAFPVSPTPAAPHLVRTSFAPRAARTDIRLLNSVFLI